MSKKIITHESAFIEDNLPNKSENIIYKMFWGDRTSQIIYTADKKINCWALINNGVRGLFDNIHAPLDKVGEDIENNFSSCKHLSLKMMDRIDPRKDLSYEKRIKLFRYLLSFWLNVLENEQIDLVIFKSTPHEVVDYVLFEVANFKKKNKIIFISQYYGGIYLVSDDYRFNHRSITYRNSNFSGISESILKTNKNIVKDYRSAEPIYDKIRKTKAHYNEKRIFFVFLNILTLKLLLNYKLSLKDKFYQSYFYIKNKINILDYKESKNTYTIISKKFRKPEKYIYFALHYQPENTTSPMGGYYVDQYMVLSVLSSVVFPDCFILVKEHPMQYLGDSYAYISRNPDYYEPFRSLDNVLFVPFETDHFELLDDSIFTVSVNGTIGWESILRGKPTLVFGEAWYQTAPGVFRITDKATCMNAVDKIFSGINIDQSKINSWLKDFLSTCTNEMYFSEEEASWHGKNINSSNTDSELRRVFNFFFNKYWPKEFAENSFNV